MFEIAIVRVGLDEVRRWPQAHVAQGRDFLLAEIGSTVLLIVYPRLQETTQVQVNPASTC